MNGAIPHPPQPAGPYATGPQPTAPAPSLVTLCHVTYALHALGLAIGAFGASTVIGSFLFGWPSIIAVILNYIKRGDAQGTWLASHFDWQIRTFWLALFWATAIFLAGLILAIVIIGFAIWVLGLLVLGIWAIYRIARGWLRLKDGRQIEG